MLQSQLFYKTLKEDPKDEQSINAKLLLRAAFVHKEMAGVFSYLPLGLRVLRKIENIIREEMDNIGGQEIFMSVLQPKAIWEETGRWSKMGEIMYRCQEESGKEVGLGSTHEEMITDIIRRFVNSYEDLPLYLYQIQTKFRKELRAKSGLLRGREFGMKDLYSFHSSEEDFRKFYEIIKKSYLKIIKKCGLDPIFTEASGGDFTEQYTHEFQVLAKDGEDTIIYCEKRDFSENKEISKLSVGQKCPKCGFLLKEGKSIEVGNIFPLGTRYSKDMNAYFIDKDGQRKLIIMGCYGLGLSRLIGSIVEVHNDEKGIIWPSSVAPFQVHLIHIQDKKGKVREEADKLYVNLQKENVEVLYDDRINVSVGEKLAEADLIGIPIRIIISEKTIAEKSVEIKKRSEANAKLVKIKELGKVLKL
ncbi:MAG: aminoacyl--tRNA ligase-related protein [Candidatus Parcubacteria bacterium]|nr:aminoacyl--tRNA ligase-related protein [Candidatus Parcubacteria bacterium]